MQNFDSETVLKVALAMTPGVTSAVVRHLEDCGVSVKDFFELDNQELSRALRLNDTHLFDRYYRDKALFDARAEMAFMNQHHIRAIFMGDDDYPARMADVADAPVAIYVLGDCDLNEGHLMSVVGTRRCTAYGVDFCKKFVAEMAGYFSDLNVVSGLAYGIDAAAHTAALDAGVRTVAVVAHGLSTIYPAAHRDLAKRIVKGGGAIVSEYPHTATAFRGHFLQRNRIVAAMCDATVVVESEIKGGAMSTANHAFNYNREVFALPGRVNDVMSAGCNHIIRRHKASLLTCAADLIEATGWEPLGVHVDARQRCLFPELEGDSKTVYDYLRFEDEPRGIDSVHAATRIPMPTLMSLLSELEFDGIVMRHPGNRFTVAT